MLVCKSRFAVKVPPLSIRIEVLECNHDRWPIQVGVPAEWRAVDSTGRLIVPDSPGSDFLGFEDLDVLVRPGTLIPRAFAVARARDEERDGRRVWTLAATASFEPLMGTEARNFAVMGADAYRFAVDQEFGIVLDWHALVDGAPARGGCIRSLTVDQPLAAEVFECPGAPLPPPHLYRRQTAPRGRSRA